jgi:hypothetical protein
MPCTRFRILGYPGGVWAISRCDRCRWGERLAAVGLPTRQQVEHLQARLFVPIMFMLEALPELIDMFADVGGYSVHGLPSKRTSLSRLCRVAATCTILN